MRVSEIFMSLAVAAVVIVGAADTTVGHTCAALPVSGNSAGQCWRKRDKRRDRSNDAENFAFIFEIDTHLSIRIRIIDNHRRKGLATRLLMCYFYTVTIQLAKKGGQLP